jgi:hypothetical protein
VIVNAEIKMAAKRGNAKLELFFIHLTLCRSERSE